jgi:cold-inducible RNA-binding protein
MKIYVGNLPFSIDDAALEELFKTHGQVDSAKVITDRDTGRSRGFGFVEMEDDEEARKAIEAINGTEVEGRTLTANKAKPKAKRERRGGGGGRNRW